MGGVLGLGLQGLGDDVLHLGVGDRARGAGPRLVVEAVQARGEEAAAPLADGGPVDGELGGDGAVVQALGARQDDPGPGGESLCGLGPARPVLKGLPLVVGQGEGLERATDFAQREAPLSGGYAMRNGGTRF